MSEKALSIGSYCAASGAYTLFGLPSPVENSPEVVDIILNGWLKRFGGGIEFEPDVDALINKALTALDRKREALGLPEWDPQRFGQSGDRLMEEVLANLDEGEPLNVYSVSR
jgi:carbon-monoxide dehydrogenase catalytic subunit